ncbi:MAG: class I SAM-dependent methyltransferase [Kiritimatiellae bacterium]|jgi:demethylmenaquinone methyltransferase/2-methoxy-6-polyprenyl-1,4-benzoquinol methylase|nr:class I SAM-dependent methyltransferase [Kiritimatiellia bacterium]
MKQRIIIKRQKEFFNRHAEKWMDMWYLGRKAAGRRRFQREFRRLFELAPIKKNDVILDAGCGSGVLVPYILRRLGAKGKLHEVDYAEKMIAVNRSLHKDPRLEFHAADVHDLPLAAKSCDGAFCFSCFPHFRNKPKALRSMQNVLKSGGWLLLAHFDSPEALNHHHAHSHRAVKHDRMPDEAGMRALFAKAGLTVARHVNEDGFYAFLAKAKRPARASQARQDSND